MFGSRKGEGNGINFVKGIDPIPLSFPRSKQAIRRFRIRIPGWLRLSLKVAWQRILIRNNQHYRFKPSKVMIEMSQMKRDRKGIPRRENSSELHMNCMWHVNRGGRHCCFRLVRKWKSRR